MQRSLLLASFFFVSVTSKIYAQQSVAINEDGSAPNSSAILDIKSANKGLLIPRVASTGAVTAPATGLLVYITGSGFFYNAGTSASPQWLSVTALGNAFNSANQLVQLNGSGQLPAVSGANLNSLNAANLSSGTVSTARLGSGTANNTTFLRGDGTWAVVGDSYPLFSSTIGSGNVNGNGTFYLTTTGISAIEKDFARLLNGPCTAVKLTAVAEGALGSGYTLSLRKGVFSGGTVTFSDIPSSAITVSGGTLVSVTVPAANLVSGNLLGVKFVGSATVASQAKTIYVSCSCAN